MATVTASQPTSNPSAKPSDFPYSHGHPIEENGTRMNDNHGLSNTMANSGYPGDNQFAGLVEAATAAAGQEADWSQNGDVEAAAPESGRPDRGHYQLEGLGGNLSYEDGFENIAQQDQFTGPARNLRSSTNGQESAKPNTRKRKRGYSPIEVSATGGPFEDDSLDIRELPPQQSLSEARAAGVHSAAALFRRPSSTSKKYTRPPMSKLFSSLELSPENFLHLQAAAKAYMLDDAHPERRDCVGQRGKGDTEMVKLRLWNCVRAFLEVEGNGERFFGEHVLNDGMGPRRLIWPRDQQKIITSVIPLLRRMVTNERQRQYAIETRKGGSEDKKRTRVYEEDAPLSIPAHETTKFWPQGGSLEFGLKELLPDGDFLNPDSAAQFYDAYNEGSQLDNLGSLSRLSAHDWHNLVATIDSHCRTVHNGEAPCDDVCEADSVARILSSGVVLESGDWSAKDGAAKQEQASQVIHDVFSIIKNYLSQRKELPPLEPDRKKVASQKSASKNQYRLNGKTSPSQNVSQPPSTLRVNILRHGKRILPRFDIPADQCPDIETMRRKIVDHYSERTLEDLKFQVWLPDGLVPIQNDGEWMVALLSASTVDWMDGDLRVIVNLGAGNT